MVPSYKGASKLHRIFVMLMTFNCMHYLSHTCSFLELTFQLPVCVCMHVGNECVRLFGITVDTLTNISS